MQLGELAGEGPINIEALIPSGTVWLVGAGPGDPDLLTRNAEKLIAASLPGATPVLLVENASFPDERRFFVRLDLLALTAASAMGSGPALLLIGEAVRQPGAIRSPATHDSAARHPAY